MAWQSLGFKPAGFSEIEPFPSAVLAHHYPDVPNFGDMNNFREWKINGAIDIVVGGTPCQAFSIAGERKSLSDERGNLTLTFCRLCDHFNPDFIAWENVPGVLNTKDNAFGCFLGELTGGGELKPSGERWTNAGCVFGPTRTVAWRILDAQHFGLAQRRKRVFLVASSRKDINPAEILFEFDGVRRDTPRSREKRHQAPSGSDRCTYCKRGFRDFMGGDLSPTLLVGGDEGQNVLVVHGSQDPIGSAEIANAIGRNGGLENCFHVGRVRKSTPIENERLQGFPDNYTQIPWRGKPKEDCPDGHRYRALGNGMAVPIMSWIGERIQSATLALSDSKRLSVERENTSTVFNNVSSL